MSIAVAVAAAPVPAVASFGDADVEASGPADGPTSEVDKLNAEAVDLFSAGDYEGAVAKFEAAYALSPEPNYLFNIGRVYEEQGNFDKALEYYQRFVKSPGVEIEARELAVERIRILKEVQSETEAAADPVPVEDPEPAPAVEPEPEEEPDEPIEEKPDATDNKPPMLRIAGFALLGVGGAVLATGTGFGISASQKERDLEGLRSIEARSDVIDTGERNALVADIMFIAGGTVALTGLILVLVSLRKKRAAPPSRAMITPTLTPRAQSVSVSVRF